MLDLVGNPDCLFSYAKAHFIWLKSLEVHAKNMTVATFTFNTDSIEVNICSITLTGFLDDSLEPYFLFK